MFEIKELILRAPAIFFGLAIHEFAHAYVANRLGDPTPRLAGRLTLNPLRHLDPIGTIALFIFRFGWAKPVPINPHNFSNPRRDAFLTALAGPMSNFIAAFLFGMLLQLSFFLRQPFFTTLFSYFLLYNLILSIFNLLPIPPLDGSKILLYIIPYKYSFYFMQFEGYGIFILLGLIFLGQLTGVPIIWRVIYPFIAFFSRLFSGRLFII